MRRCGCCEIVRESDSVELKLTIPEGVYRSGARALGVDPLEARSVRCSSSTHLTSRSTRRAWSLGRAACRAVARLGGQAAAGRTGRDAPELRQVAEHGRRGRRDAGRLRVLGLPEGQAAPEAITSAVTAGTDPKAVLEGAARVLRGPRARRPGPRRPLGARPDLRAQAQAPARGVLAPARRRDVAVPRRVANRRAVDQVPPGERLDVVDEVRSFLQAGRRPRGEQQTKTKTALEFFSSELLAQPT